MIGDEPKTSGIKRQRLVQLRRMKPKDSSSPGRNTEVERRRVPPAGAKHVKCHQYKAHGHVQARLKKRVLEHGLFRLGKVRRRMFPVRVSLAAAQSAYCEHEM